MRNDRERLLDIEEAIEKIEKYTHQGRAAFNENELIQNWVVRHLQIIGEACRAISEPLKAQYPAVPWSSIIGMRNIVIHLYFGIDEEVVWSVVAHDLPKLKEQIKTILATQK